MSKKVSLAVVVGLLAYAIIAIIILGKPQTAQAATEAWSNPATWGGTVPAPGTVVVIPIGKTILLDTSVSLKSLDIQGTLIFDNQNLNLTADWVIVHGSLQIGSEATPYTNRAIITLTGSNPAENIMGMGTKVLGVMGGTLEIHGEQRDSWVRLNATAPKGANQITLEKAVSWRVGDKIVLASTDYEDAQAEEVTITAVSGATVSFSEVLKYEHFGQIQTFAGQTFDTRGEVGLLTRNITIQGDTGSETSGFGGHVMMMAGSKAKVEGAELYRMGQKFKVGRYPIHWHLVGDTNGDYAKNNSIHFSFNRCLTVHGTNKVLVQSNVGYDAVGHCYFLEDGIENKNVFENNLGIRTKKPKSGEEILASDKTPATFWITNPDNIFRNNVAAGSDSKGFWLAFPEHPTGLSTNASIFPRQTPLGEFNGNVAHSNGDTGIFLDNGPKPDGTTESTTYKPRQVPGTDSPAVTAELKNATVYKNRSRGIWTRGYPLIMSNFKMADNAVGATFATSDNGGAFLKNSVLVGETANKGTPPSYETKGLDGRSLPQPWEATASILGFQFYDGLVGVQNTTLVNYQPNSQRKAGGLSYLEENRFSLYPSNFAEAITFINSQPVYFRPSNPNRDGDRNRVFVDKDGSVTGTAGTSVTDNNFFLAMPNCTQKLDWNAFVCVGNVYGQLYISNQDANPASLKPLTLWREEDGGTQTIIGCCEDDSNTSASISLITNKSYMLRFPSNLPQKLRLVLRQSDARWVRVVLQYPTADFKVIRYGSVRTPKASLAALDAATDSSYFYDSQSGKLYLKLAATGSYEELNVEATNALPVPGNYFHTLPPTRLYDSRLNAVNGAIIKTGAITTGQTRTVKVTGLAGIPVGAKGILANVTVANAQVGGYLTFYPADSTESNTATVNWYRDGARVVANFAIIGLSSNGEFKVKAGGNTDFIIDVTGYLDDSANGGGVFRTLGAGVNPRLYDSRATGTGLSGKGQGALTIDNGVRTVTVSGAGSPQSIPAGATALVVNVTAANTVSGGYITVYPAGGSVPTASTVNWNPRNSFPNVPKDVANLAIVPITNGQISMISGGAPGSGAGAEVILDVLGYVDSNTANPTLFNPLYTPLRLYDSRTTIASLFAGSSIKGVVPAEGTRTIQIGGTVSVPLNAKSVLVRITTVDVGGGGYLAMYPGPDYPGNSNVNTNGGNQQIGNVAVVTLNNGSFIVKNGGQNAKGFIIDVIGYIL